MLATDVVARGIDIENISLVINYDIPIKKESYIHRTGRTGRSGLEGKVITFVTSKQEYYMKSIMEYISYNIPLLKTPTEEVANCRSAFESKRMDKQALKNVTICGKKVKVSVAKRGQL